MSLGPLFERLARVQRRYGAAAAFLILTAVAVALAARGAA